MEVRSLIERLRFPLMMSCQLRDITGGRVLFQDHVFIRSPRSPPEHALTSQEAFGGCGEERRNE